jgi:hypothetical protein
MHNITSIIDGDFGDGIIIATLAVFFVIIFIVSFCRCSNKQSIPSNQVYKPLQYVDRPPPYNNVNYT